MDQLFVDLIGKLQLNPPKIITIVAENFSLLEDKARFLKATLAIPAVKQLPLKDQAKRLIQIGPPQQEIFNQINKENWGINLYENFDESVCDKIEKDLSNVCGRSILFINDLSRLELNSHQQDEAKKLLKLAYQLKREGHFIVILYQNSTPGFETSTLRDLEYISDAVVRAKSCKAGYFKSMWFQPPPITKTLMPTKIQTSYYTSKIGKFYWSQDLLCFYDRRIVSKAYNLDDEGDVESDKNDEDAEDAEEEDLTGLMSNSRIREDDELLPYTRAADPERSRIFYYPDKEDDIDEDDPDNDLGI